MRIHFFLIGLLVALTSWVAHAASDRVIPVPGGFAIFNHAHPFDLQGKRVEFVPQGTSYKTRVELDRAKGTPGRELPVAERIGEWFANGWKLKLPFEFPFGGKRYSELTINRRGNVTFDKPEWVLAKEADRNLWATGGVTSLANGLDMRSYEGRERMIAAFWADFSDTKVFVDSQPGAVLISWVATHGYGIRAEGPGVSDAVDAELPSGADRVSTFRMRLSKDGRIELSYPDVREVDGLVGVFNGAKAPSTLVTEIKEPRYAGGPTALVNIKSVRVYEEGTQLRFTFDMDQPVPKSMPTGSIEYRIMLKRGGVGSCEFYGMITGSSRSTGNNCLEPPRNVVFESDGKLAHLRVSRLVLGDVKELGIAADVVWWGGPQGAFSQINLGYRAPALQASIFKRKLPDLSASVVGQGNVYEAFHRAVIHRTPLDLLAEVYKTHKEKEEFALVLTDFAIDDFYGMAGGAIQFNYAIKGIGPKMDTSISTEHIGNAKLFSTMQPIWIGSPHNTERGTALPGMAFKSHMPFIRLVDHEFNHRYGMNFAFIHPESKARVELCSGDGHWIEGFNVPSAARVWSTYADKEYPETSNMGGYSWVDNGDGTFTRKDRPYHGAMGYSALDLYAFGLIPADEVPDTFLIEGLQHVAGDKFKGRKVAVRMSDVLAALGPRVPSYKEAPRKFRLNVYLLHEGATPRAASLARAKSAAAAIRAHYPLASGGRMTLE